MSTNVITEAYPRACIIAAPSSGSGKTVITIGLIRALVNQGYRVQPYKNGPDYLDVTWQGFAAGKASYNLDTWMIKRDILTSHFHETLSGNDIGIIEGAMGLYDGYEGTINGSTADLAIMLKLPVILVIDCEGLSGSVAPIVYGFKQYNKKCSIAGIILNNTSSSKHEKYCREALVDINIQVLGCIPRNAKLNLNHRHLGLIAASDDLKTEKTINEISSIIEKNIDLELLYKTMKCLPNACFKSLPYYKNHRICKIAIAKDEAFHFYYQANLDLLEKNGAELVFFSPLKNKTLPSGINGLYIGGGYPEEYAELLSKNTSMRMSIYEFSINYGCIYAECGGYMYLGRMLIKNKFAWPMCGIFDIDFEMNENKRKCLGYRKVKQLINTVLGEKNLSFRGHEFHYSNCIEPEKYNIPFSIVSRSDERTLNSGMSKLNTLASYIHIHFLSNPAIPENFITNCTKCKTIL